MIPPNGWIKLHRQITEWQHWGNPNVLATFVHLLTLANWEDREWRGITIQRGQLVTTIRRLSENTGIPRSTLWRVLNTLTETEEITVQSIGVGERKDYSLITILNYDIYQGQNEPEMSPETVGHGVRRGVGHGWDTEKPQLAKGSKGDENGTVRHGVRHGVGRTKEYIRSNKKNDIYITSSSAHARENENEKKLEGNPDQVNTEEEKEKKEKNCAKKERKDYQAIKQQNTRVTDEMKKNTGWVQDTARLFGRTEQQIAGDLERFELNATTGLKELTLPDAYNHFKLWYNYEVRAARQRQRNPRGHPPETSPDPNAAWQNPQIQALIQRNREESERQLREFRERQRQKQLQNQ